ncbi:hypothetical protein [Pseudonocardia sp. ICBG1293]|uniref:hypothetical protein n=1 Tax=Pseudonocardia sp. ICBG1293 TaxID=2844382 RepID=UPI001CCDE575|nr:hypothetical protein [Pseudonocardia sp. ICBG1293]
MIRRPSARTGSRAARVAVAGVAVLVLSGCGPLQEGLDALPTGSAAGSGDSASGEPPGAESGAMQRWTGDLCEAVGEVSAVATRQRTFDPARIPELRQVLADQVREVEGAVAGLGEDVRRLGPPPVEDGARVLDEVTGIVEDRRESLAKSADFVAESDRSGTIGYVQVARAAQSGFTAGPMLARAISRVPEIEASFAAAPRCRAIDSRSDEDAGGGSAEPTGSG